MYNWKSKLLFISKFENSEEAKLNSWEILHL